MSDNTIKLGGLHHMALVCKDMERTVDFYTNVLGLADVPQENFARTKASDGHGYDGEIRFATDVHMQMHLAEKDVLAGFNTGQIVNPVEKGHIAYRTDDLDAFIARLEAQGVPYSDWGFAAVAGWRQIFFYDPDGNVIEVHEVAET